MQTVKFRVCADNSANSVDVIPPARELPDADAGADTVTFRFPTSGPCPDVGTVRFFVPVGEAYQPLECDELTDCISIVRRIAAHDGITGEPVRMEDSPLVRVGRPSHCDWRECVVMGAIVRPDRMDSELFSEFRRLDISPDGVIDADLDSGLDCSGYDGRHDIPVRDNGILVPGMAVSATHVFRNGSKSYSSICGRKYYRTCSITGGVITAVVGEYDTPDIRYRVLCQSMTITCPPSDFVRWAVGDYVFLVVGPGECALACDLGEASIPETSPPEGRGEAGICLKIINNYREEIGVPRLSWNSKLEEAADAHARDMIANNFFSHTGSDGSTPEIRIGRTGYAAAGLYWSGENIAMGTGPAATDPAEIFVGWRRSPGHDANMRNPDYREAAIVSMRGADGRVVWVNTFGAVSPLAGGAETGSSPAGDGGWVIVPMQIGSKGA